jgi:hypothetical protein
MNKKLLMFALPILAIGLVAAGVVGYYALYSATFTVNNIDGMGEYTFTPEESVEYGQTLVGESITLTNDLENNRNLLITDDSGEDVEVTYKSDLTLTKKTVNFNLDVWEVPEGAEQVEIEYVLVGDEFTAEVTSGELTDYVLIYYKDNSDRFNNPAKAILVEDVEGNLPYETDGNADEYNYCDTGEYLTCNGAKIWYVPEVAIDSEGNIDWSQASNFYFETKLIQYNSDGEITFYSGDSLTITPEYTIANEYLEGEVEVITTIA